MSSVAKHLELLLISLILCAIIQCVTVNADTKVLNVLSLNQPGYNSRDEVISLENAGTVNEELVFKGNRTTEFGPANKFGLIFMETTEYIADNNGYRVHYRIVALPLAQTRLSAGVLQSAAG
ncbi:uncharacterized protein LOC128855871 isoform X1 [Anastrepha ludens]|uniref:uncharacterized protein LOC128855871 isoform X1 n=1 Tax=Anastrepha ludens TaxID=28586 RepID=UPI0023AE87CA|nr:uncharacterized protein LOC128855871 isoform X1 [Anastrepha ludens]